MTTRYKRKLEACDGLIQFLCLVPVISVLMVIGYFIGLIL